MKIVVDSNQLQSPTLRTYLSKSKSNFAVLTDYAAMEAYKGHTLISIYKSMAVLSEFPEQVIVLKGTRKVCGLRGRNAGLQRRFIDAGQTAGFGKYVGNLRLAKNGNRHVEQQLLELGREATSHLDRMLKDAETAGSAFADIASMYSKEERDSIGIDKAIKGDFVNKTVKQVIHIAGLAFRDHPNAHFWPDYRELPNTFLFRAALCTMLIALDWAAKGGAKNAHPATLRNDFVDANFAAYATYFDGLMSADAKMVRIHAEARIWLTSLFDCSLPCGIEGAHL